jgi:hypothetical protein
LQQRRDELINENFNLNKNIFDFEELLNNEIERILSDIYNSNLQLIRSNQTSQQAGDNNSEYLKKFKNHMDFYSQKGKGFNMVLLQILANKISKLIPKLKDKIYDNPEFKHLRDKFLEIKRTYEANKRKEWEKTQTTGKKKKNEFDWGNLSLQIVNSLPIFLQKQQTEGGPKFDSECINKIIQSLMRELKILFTSLIFSSKNIEFVFESNISFLSSGGHFSFDEINKEEFSSAVTGDEFLRAVTLHIGQRNNKHIEELNELLSHGVDDIHGESDYKEMHRFVDCIEDELDQICPPEEDEISDYEDSTIFHKIYKKDQFKDANIDDLLNYINADQKETKPKKGKKKNKKLKNNNPPNTNLQKQNSSNLLNETQLLKEKIDSEIEEFKNTLRYNTQHACYVRKIKPSFSKEWVLSIRKNL